MEYRLQISEVLTHSFENLDKYKVIAARPQAEQPQTKIMNPYAAMAESIQNTSDLKS